ncbi:bifunctional DNA-formamidopyrimidine glycosylase/DNA-(apurinic or apyrimidinic site) lyase [Pelagibacterales bacterium SAG-MED01]|nr:bifunctional DNA-formamidopyrimidine glycosylase/DNA-(apurinic or apyrimidinic site) lyase [Pelagibacterales bacterium SAG-MED01]
MPELPEVEIVRRSLDEKIKQKKVKKVIVRNRNLRFKIPLNFGRFLKNKKIIKVQRFSKYLILCLSDSSYCLLHLGMSGTVHLIHSNKKNSITNTSFYNSPELPKKHNHIEIIFEGMKMVYNDPRRFGFFQLIKDYSSLKKRFNHLGPEPFQSKFNLRYVCSFFKKKEKNIKNFLIDQNFVSGIGNIYASEILFLGKINPNKKVNSLIEKDCKKIIFNSKKVLFNAISKGGSSIRDFKNISGTKGSFQKNFNVYQREGLKCKRFRCKGIIKKKIISNRSTFFCNTCQK